MRVIYGDIQNDLNVALMFLGRPFHIASSSPTPVWVRADAEATKFQGQEVGLFCVFINAS